MVKIILNLNFEIDKKPDIETILSSSGETPVDELHVLDGSDYAERLRSIKGFVSLALIANPDERFEVSGYTLGFIEKLKIIYKNQQVTPLIINNELLNREKRDFRDNEVYSNYEICIINPPVNLFDFLKKRNTLAPYATPDRI